MEVRDFIEPPTPQQRLTRRSLQQAAAVWPCIATKMPIDNLLKFNIKYVFRLQEWPTGAKDFISQCRQARNKCALGKRYPLGILVALKRCAAGYVWFRTTKEWGKGFQPRNLTITRVTSSSCLSLPRNSSRATIIRSAISRAGREDHFFKELLSRSSPNLSAEAF